MSLDNVSGNNNDKRQPKNVGNNIPKSDFAGNKKMQKLFDFFNTNGNDNLLDNDEVMNLWDRVATYTNIDNNSVFSKEEAQTLLDESGINMNADAGEEISVGDLFGFLKNVANKNTGVTEDDVSDIESTQAASGTDPIDNVGGTSMPTARTTVTNSGGQSFTLEEFSEQEVKNLTVDAFNADIEKANQIYNSQRKTEGIISDAVNGINEAFDSDLARSKVGRMLMYQNARNRWLQKANDGNLTQREYLESKIDLLAKCILANIDDDNNTKKNIVKLASYMSPASKLFTNYLRSGKTKIGEKEAAEAELNALKSLLANLETPESLDALMSNVMEGDYFDNLSANHAETNSPIATLHQVLPEFQGNISYFARQGESLPVYIKGNDKIKLVYDNDGKAHWEQNGHKIDYLEIENKTNNPTIDLYKKQVPNFYPVSDINDNLMKELGFKREEAEEHIEVCEFTLVENTVSSLANDKLKTFEETFRDEFHLEYNEEAMLDYIQKNATLEFMVAAHNRDVEVDNLLSSSIRQLQPFTTYKDKSHEYFRSNETGQMQLDAYEAAQKARDPYLGQEKAYDKGSPIDIHGDMDREAARKGLQNDIVNTIIALYGSNAIQQGIDGIGIKGLKCIMNGNNAELVINGKKCSNEELIDIANKIIDNTHQNYLKTLNGKTLEQYSNETKRAYNTAFVAPESDRTLFMAADATSELASDYAEAIQHGAGAIHTATNTVGMLLAIGGQVIPGGQVLTPIGMAITTFGSPVLSLAEHTSSQEGLTQDQWGEIKEEVAINVLLTASGMGIGKVSGSAYKVMTLGQKVSTCRKLLAWGAEVGIDASMSLCADMAITGQIDFTGEGIAQLQSIIVGLCHAKGNFKGYLDTHAGSNPTSNDTQSQAVRPQGAQVQNKQDPVSTQPKVRPTPSQPSHQSTNPQGAAIPRQDVTIDGQKINIPVKRKYQRPDTGYRSYTTSDDLMSSGTGRSTPYETTRPRISPKNDSRVREMCTDKNGQINSKAEELLDATYSEGLDAYYSTRINPEDSRRMDMETLLNSCRKENGEFDNDLLACARQLLESVPLNCDKDAFSPRDFELLLKNMQKAQSGTRQDMLSASKKLLETGITPYEAGSIISYCCGANIYGDIYNTNFSFDQKAFDKIYELAKNMPESGRRSYTLKLKYLVQNSMIYCGKSGENHIYRFYDENFEKLKMYYFDADYRHDANIPKSSDGTIDLDDFSSNTRNELNEILEKRIRERYGTEADDLIAKCQGSTEKMWDLSQGKKPEVLTTEQEVRLKQLATDDNGHFNQDAFELAKLLNDFLKYRIDNYKDIEYYLKMCNGNYKEFAEIVSQIKNNLNKNGLKLDGPYITIDKAKNSKIPYDWYLRYGDMNQVLEYSAIHLDYLLDFYCLGRGKYMDYLKNNDFMDNLYYAYRIRGFIRNAKRSNLTDSEDKLTEYIIETIRDKKPTKEEHSAIADYKGDNSEDMNTGRTAYWQQQAGYLESYINNHTLNFDNGLQVIRHDGSYECLNKITFADGTPLSEVLKNPDKYKDKLTESSLQTLSGQSYINERFVSTTADAGGVFPHNPIKWELTLGSGTQAAIIDIPLAIGEIECEFLINRNSKFTIESIDADGIPITIKATVTTP